MSDDDWNEDDISVPQQPQQYTPLNLDSVVNSFGNQSIQSNFSNQGSFGNSTSGSRGPQNCFNCNGTGHISKNCPEERKSRGTNCYKCHQDGHIARNCPQENATNGNDWGSGQNDRRENKCYNCNRFGHMSRECPEERQERKPRSRKCFKCNEEGHISQECPNGATSNGLIDWGGSGQDEKENRYGRGDSNREMKCYNCNGIGHMSKDCTEERQERQPRSLKCFKCNEEGHISQACPSAQKNERFCCSCGKSGHATMDCDLLPEDCKGRALGNDGVSGVPPTPHIPEELPEDELFAQGVDMGVNFDKYANIPVKVSGRDPPPSINNFSDAGLRKILLENVERAKYINATPIQKYSIPIIMKGRDLMSCAQTGSGKTAAFLLPILHYILENDISHYAYEKPAKPTALIVSPTRELTRQIHEEARKFAYGSVLKICIAYGGTASSSQQQKIEAGCHILVATTGRLKDFLEKRIISFEMLKFLVLDEADRMLDMGFSDDIKTIVNHHSTPKKTDRQTLMFSATFSNQIQKMSCDYLNDYIFVVVGTVGGANEDVKQSIIKVHFAEKRDVLLNFIIEKLQINAAEKFLVFVEAKRMADFIGLFLCNKGVNATTIHGDRFQNQREEALNEFKRGIRNVLVATAVAARGLDIKGVGYVINYELPKDIDEYVHRIGRTGRVGNRGNAISYFDDNRNEDIKLAPSLVKILQEAHQEVPEWLEEMCQAGEGVSRGNFGAQDIRTGVDFNQEYNAAPAFGGPNNLPQVAPQICEEESWDD